jgi:serine/threonine protein kinase
MLNPLLLDGLTSGRFDSTKGQCPVNCLMSESDLEHIPPFLNAKYDDVRFIDDGGHGKVYRCVSGDRTTAVKVLYDLNRESRNRFMTEISIMKSLDHEHIVKVYDAGETDGFPWYESEFATQGTFGELYSYLIYSALDARDFFIQICRGVKYLHDQYPPIYHRDLKPSNILVFGSPGEDQPLFKIGDFGIALIAGNAPRLTRTGALVGTSDYMAPEQKKFPRIKNPRIDIYSLGITFLEAFSGDPTPNPENRDEVPKVLRPIITKMIRHDPNERYQNVDDVILALADIPVSWLLAGEETSGDEAGRMYFHVNIGRLIENAQNALIKATPENVLEQLSEFEKKLERLGPACNDHTANAISNLPGEVLKLIDAADPHRLSRLVSRLMDAAEQTRPDNFFTPDPNMWSFFLYEAFNASSYTGTKFLCLEGLVKYFADFGTEWNRKYLWLVAQRIEDPNQMAYLGECLRGAGAEAVAELLDGVLEDRPLDVEALKVALSAPPKENNQQ